MFLEDIKNINSSKKDLKEFGLTLGIVLMLIGGLLYWRGREFYFYFSGLGSLFALLGILAPTFLKPFQKVWIAVALTIGWFMTHLILGVIFYVVVTPISLIARMSGKKFLDLKIDKNARSHWDYKKGADKPLNKNHYEKQF